MAQQRTRQIAVRVEDDLREDLARVAARQGMDSSNVIRRLAREHVTAVDSGLYPFVLRPGDLEHPDQNQAAA